MENFMMALAFLIPFLLLLFSIAMFVDCWQYSGPLWLILFMLFSLPAILMYFSPITIIHSLFGCGLYRCARKDTTPLVMLIASFIPFCFSMVYYVRKFRSRYLSVKPFFITILVLSLLFFLHYLISAL